AYPQRTGEFTIGPFTYRVDGEAQRLSGKLKVVASSDDAAASQSWNELVFAKIAASRETAYVQEPFDLTLSIYSRPGLQIRGIENLRGIPETGLSVTEWKESSSTREQINGELYEVRRFKNSVRPLASGPFDFAPTLTVQIVRPQQRRQRDPFFGGLSLFDRVQTVPVDLTADAARVEVLPLPTLGKPENFSGAVGRFQFGVTANPKEVTPGDPITLQMTIVGEGNYDRILPPALPENVPFRLFGDAVRQQGNNGVRFEQVISPRDAAVTNIPPLEFSYFDSAAGTYRTLHSDPIPITVNASSNNSAQVFAASNTQVALPADQPFASESDIQRFIKWLKKGWKRIRPWLWTLPAALGCGILLFIVRKLQHRRRKDTARIRRQQAPKAARKALRDADFALRQADTAGFYEALGN
ncbi:MAG TPA: BatD family protein, partial [Tichowtungia sp.]|nr:BatD family protein [Tichowtungia sp.]